MRFLHVLIILLISSSCQKDQHQKKLKPCNKNFENTSSITLGSDDDIYIFQVNQQIATGYNEPGEALSVDFELDGEEDLEFYVSNYGSPGTGINGSARVQCLNEDVFLRVMPNYDTTFYHESVTCEGSNPVNAHCYYITSCERIAPNDSIVKIYNRVLTNEEGDVITLSGDWANHGTSLVRPNWGYPIDYGDEVNDTVKYFHQSYVQDCHNIYGTHYLAIKKTYSCGLEKLGWVKFGVADGYEMGITVFEIALQK